MGLVCRLRVSLCDDLGNLSKAFGIGPTFRRAKWRLVFKRCGSVRHPPIAQNCPSVYSHQDEIPLNRIELTGPDIEL
jgi:hypothetical protein